MEENRFNTNVKVLVEEAVSIDHSERWYEAQAETARIHSSLPSIISKTAIHLPSNGFASRETAFRIGDAAIRETAATGKTNLDAIEEMVLSRRVFRSVLIQEGAAEILRDRGPGQSIDNFMGLNNPANTDTGGIGSKSLEILQKQMGLDLKSQVHNLNDTELRALSVGAYDRINPETLKTITVALEVSQKELGTRHHVAQIGNNIEHQPWMRHPRAQILSSQENGEAEKLNPKLPMQQSSELER